LKCFKQITCFWWDTWKFIDFDPGDGYAAGVRYKENRMLGWAYLDMIGMLWFPLLFIGIGLMKAGKKNSTVAIGAVIVIAVTGWLILNYAIRNYF
jgi:hypothetical protein